MADLIARVTRERALIMGLTLAVLEAVANGEITAKTAVPVLAGIVLRQVVQPYHRGDDRDVDDPRGIAADG